MSRKWMLILYAAALALGLFAGIQWAAYRLGDGPELGWAIRMGHLALYPPWSILGWYRQYGGDDPDPFNQAGLIALGFMLPATALLAIARRQGPPTVKAIGLDRWAKRSDIRKAGLLSGQGTVVGLLGKELLTYNGPEHQLVSGASRSGKGVGHVVPTLLNWPGSVLVYDVKNELWDITAGFRNKFSHTVFYNPTRLDSVRINPLLDIRPGDAEIRDTQNVVEMLVNPTGAKQTLDIWDQQASQLLVALILHVLYTEPPEHKNLGMVRQRLLDFQATCEAMATTHHRKSSRMGWHEPHPEIRLVARELLSQPEKFQASVRGTTAGYLTLYADPIVCRNTSISDFKLSDLACNRNPMTLYIQPPPSDAPRLRPLIRLLINQVCRSLMEHIGSDTDGRPKKHRLLLLLDEFPTLGRLDFFSLNLRQMAGYGIKAHLIVQSFNDIIEQYGPHNTILDNCHVLTTFASSDPVTQQKISQMTGTVVEYREGYSQPAKFFSGGHRGVSYSEQVRPLLQPGDVREFPTDQELIFVTGCKPIKCSKLRYYADPRFTSRLLSAPDQSRKPDLPEKPVLAWLGIPGARIPTPSADSRRPALQGAQSRETKPATMGEGQSGKRDQSGQTTIRPDGPTETPRGANHTDDSKAEDAYQL
jgi:type IV secretion system protein VirD4